MAIRMSNNVIGALNVVTLLLSATVLGAGVWLRTRADGAGCDHFLSTPAIVLGAALVAVSLAGLAGACCRATWLLWLYLLAMSALVLALLAFTAFAFAVTARGAGDAAADGDAHRLGDYSAWLRRHVEGTRNWARIRGCLADAGVCDRVRDEKNATSSLFLGAGALSSVESGCCRPPASCNFTHEGGTEWKKKKGPGPGPRADPDCGRWGGDDDELCYGCDSCRAGVAGALRRDWKRAAVVNAVFLAFILVVYALGCCAYRNSRRDNFAYHSSRGSRQTENA